MIPFLPPVESITLAPQSLTFPELAKALTAAGMPTDVSPVLRSRGAFVALKNREPEAVRRILAEALGVTFRPEGTGWRMIVDPEAKDRERRLLVAYRRQASESLRDWAGARERLRGGRTYDAFAAWLDDNFKEAASTQTIPPETVMAALGEATTSGWVASQVGRDGTLAARTIDGTVAWSISATEIEKRYGFPALKLSKPQSALQSFDLSTSFDLKAGTMSLKARPMSGDEEVEFSVRRRGAIAGLSVYAEFGDTTMPLEGKDLADTFRRMGEVGTAYLESFAKPSALPATPKLEETPPLTLSIGLEKLGAEGLESVMELDPTFEVTDSMAVAPFSLAGYLDVKEAPYSGPAVPAWAEMSYARERYRKAYRERRFPWKATLRDGVWVIANPLAFLSHARPDSPTPYLTVERAFAKIPADAPTLDGSGPEKLPTWPLIEQLAKALSPDDHLRSLSYRGLQRFAQIADLLPLARFMEALPTAERDNLWKQAKSPTGAHWFGRGGFLDLQVEVTPPTPHLVHISARWRGADGRKFAADGNIDGRGFVN